MCHYFANAQSPFPTQLGSMRHCDSGLTKTLYGQVMLEKQV